MKVGGEATPQIATKATCGISIHCHASWRPGCRLCYHLIAPQVLVDTPLMIRTFGIVP
jgi:hypothetical protein